MRLHRDETFEEHQEGLRFLTALSAPIANQQLEKKLSEAHIGTREKTYFIGRSSFVDLASSPEVMSQCHDLLKSELSQFAPGVTQMSVKADSFLEAPALRMMVYWGWGLGFRTMVDLAVHWGVLLMETPA